jgi:HKD family nuclease
MKVLTTCGKIDQELRRLIEECSSCQIAVAWASIGFAAFDQLANHRSKIERMIVGTHFYQTHPQFLETFFKHPNVRCIFKPDGVFHPKVYLFFRGAGEWECLIGSPNFTQGGCDLNDEMPC